VIRWPRASDQDAWLRFAPAQVNVARSGVNLDQVNAYRADGGPFELELELER
jgi:hypothetical protein